MVKNDLFAAVERLGINGDTVGDPNHIDNPLRHEPEVLRHASKVYFWGTLFATRDGAR